MCQQPNHAVDVVVVVVITLGLTNSLLRWR
jgi:hypothetical protein